MKSMNQIWEIFYMILNNIFNFFNFSCKYYFTLNKYNKSIIPIYYQKYFSNVI